MKPWQESYVLAIREQTKNGRVLFYADAELQRNVGTIFNSAAGKNSKDATTKVYKFPQHVRKQMHVTWALMASDMILIERNFRAGTCFFEEVWPAVTVQRAQFEQGNELFVTYGSGYDRDLRTKEQDWTKVSNPCEPRAN